MCKQFTQIRRMISNNFKEFFKKRRQNFIETNQKLIVWEKEIKQQYKSPMNTIFENDAFFKKMQANLFDLKKKILLQNEADQEALKIEMKDILPNETDQKALKIEMKEIEMKDILPSNNNQKGCFFQDRMAKLKRFEEIDMRLCAKLEFSLLIARDILIACHESRNQFKMNYLSVNVCLLFDSGEAQTKDLFDQVRWIQKEFANELKIEIFQINRSKKFYLYFPSQETSKFLKDERNCQKITFNELGNVFNHLLCSSITNINRFLFHWSNGIDPNEFLNLKDLFNGLYARKFHYFLFELNSTNSLYYRNVLDIYYKMMINNEEDQLKMFRFCKLYSKDEYFKMIPNLIKATIACKFKILNQKQISPIINLVDCHECYSNLEAAYYELNIKSKNSREVEQNNSENQQTDPEKKKPEIKTEFEIYQNFEFSKKYVQFDKIIEITNYQNLIKIFSHSHKKYFNGKDFTLKKTNSDFDTLKIHQQRNAFSKEMFNSFQKYFGKEMRLIPDLYVRKGNKSALVIEEYLPLPQDFTDYKEVFECFSHFSLVKSNFKFLIQNIVSDGIITTPKVSALSQHFLNHEDKGIDVIANFLVNHSCKDGYCGKLSLPQDFIYQNTDRTHIENWNRFKFSKCQNNFCANDLHKADNPFCKDCQALLKQSKTENKCHNCKNYHESDIRYQLVLQKKNDVCV